MLVDRESRPRGVGHVAYESRDAMDRASRDGHAMREEFAQQMGSEITEVAEFELVLAHLRVPETGLTRLRQRTNPFPDRAPARTLSPGGPWGESPLIP